MNQGLATTITVPCLVIVAHVHGEIDLDAVREEQMWSLNESMPPASVSPWLRDEAPISKMTA